MYLTYTEYQDMGGTLEEAAFNDFEYEAEFLINYFTFDRLKDDDVFADEVKRCVYALVKYFLDNSEAIEGGLSGDSGNVSSYSNDGVSVSYNVLSASEAIAREQEAMERKVRTYLSGVTNSLGRRVLYRGLYPGE